MHRFIPRQAMLLHVYLGSYKTRGKGGAGVTRTHLTTSGLYDVLLNIHGLLTQLATVKQDTERDVLLPLGLQKMSGQ